MELASLLGLSAQAEVLLQQAERAVHPMFEEVDRIAEYNQAKVLKAFADCRIQAGHFQCSSGYGYSDIGRDALEALFAKTMGAQDALVRPQIVSGTHALAIGLQGLLKSGQALLYATGKPYDTLEQVIGIEPASGSLQERGVGYYQVELNEEGGLDIPAILHMLETHPEIHVVGMQRSAGYAWRRALTVEEIGKAAQAIHDAKPNCMVFVDNCYGEFTQIIEPCEVGVDCMAGSLIKNPGGGLAPTGGYLAGTTEAIEQVEAALTAPGIGRACGSYEASYRPFFQGLFLAPSVVRAAVRTALLFSQAFTILGYAVNPAPMKKRTDIIQCIRFGAKEPLCAFCRAIQHAAPVDAMATPEPWAMPGYTHEVIMAAGAFVQGSSIELSADGPICEPYTAYMQGGLTYEHGRLGCLYAIDAVLKSRK